MHHTGNINQAVSLSLPLSLSLFVDHSIDFVVMDVAVHAAAGALKAFFADLPDPLIPYSLHPELVEAASKNTRTPSGTQLRH